MKTKKGQKIFLKTGFQNRLTQIYKNSGGKRKKFNFFFKFFGPQVYNQKKPPGCFPRWVVKGVPTKIQIPKAYGFILLTNQGRIEKRAPPPLSHKKNPPKAQRWRPLGGPDNKGPLFLGRKKLGKKKAKKRNNFFYLGPKNCQMTPLGKSPRGNKREKSF